MHEEPDTGEGAIELQALRDALMDYYGTAMQEFPMAVMELERIQTMSDAEILEEAKKTGLI